MTLQNLSIEERAKGTIDLMPDNSQTLIRQSYVTIGGYHQAIKVEYIDKSSERYAFKIFINANNGNSYILEYQDNPLKVPETLPLINKMVDSF